jgi:hypothetical protein
VQSKDERCQDKCEDLVVETILGEARKAGPADAASLLARSGFSNITIPPEEIGATAILQSSTVGEKTVPEKQEKRETSKRTIQPLLCIRPAHARAARPS